MKLQTIGSAEAYKQTRERKRKGSGRKGGERKGEGKEEKRRESGGECSPGLLRRDFLIHVCCFFLELLVAHDFFANLILLLLPTGYFPTDAIKPGASHLVDLLAFHRTFDAAEIILQFVPGTKKVLFPTIYF